MLGGGGREDVRLALVAWAGRGKERPRGWELSERRTNLRRR